MSYWYFPWILKQQNKYRIFSTKLNNVKIHRKRFRNNFIQKNTRKEGSTLYLSPTLSGCHRSTANCRLSRKTVEPPRETYVKTLLASRSTTFLTTEFSENARITRYEGKEVENLRNLKCWKKNKMKRSWNRELIRKPREMAL